MAGFDPYSLAYSSVDDRMQYMYRQLREEMRRDMDQYLRSMNVPQQYYVSPQAMYGSLSVGPSNPPAPTELKEETEVCATGGIVAWRKWAVGLFDNKLKSIRGTVWEPYTKFNAACEAKTCAGATCNCGVYAFKESASVLLSDNGGFDKLKHVMGEVYLWGRVLQCKTGFRAEFAYPKTICDTGNSARKIAALYGVKTIEQPVTKVEPKKDENALTATSIKQIANQFASKYGYPGQVLPYLF